MSLAEIHNVPYPAVDYVILEDGGRIPRIVVRPLRDEYPQAPDEPGRWDGGISFGDLVQTIHPNEDGWTDANRAPHRHVDIPPPFEKVDGFRDTRVFAPMPPGAPPAEPGATVSFGDMVRPIGSAAIRNSWNGNREPEQTGGQSPAIAGGPQSWMLSAPFGAFDPRSAAEMSAPRVPTAGPVPAQPSVIERIAAPGQALPEYLRRGEETLPPAPSAEQTGDSMGFLLDRSPLDRPSFGRHQSLASRGKLLPISADEDGNAYFDPNTGLLGSLKSGLTLAGDVAAGRIELYGPDGRLTPEAIERLIDMAGLPAGGIGGTGRVAARPGSAPKPPVARLPLEQVPGMTPERARRIRALIGDEEAAIHAFPNKPRRPYEADYPGLAPAPPGAELAVTIDGARRTSKYTVGRRVVQGFDEAITPRELNELVKKMTGFYPMKVPANQLKKDAIAQYDQIEKRILVWDQLDPATMHKAVAHEFGHHLANIVEGLVKDMPPSLQAELAPLYSWGYQGPSRGQLIAPTTGKMYPALQADEELLVEAVRAYLTNPNYLKTVAPETAAYLRGKLNTHGEVREHIQFNSKTGGGPTGLETPPDRRRQEPWPPRA